MNHQHEVAYGASNGHVIEIQDGGLTEVGSVRVLFLPSSKKGKATSIYIAA